MPIKQNPEKIYIAPAEKINPVEYPSAQETQSSAPAIEDSTSSQVVTEPPVTKSAPGNLSSNFARQVEGVMEEDLEDLYQDLSDAEKLIFKSKGEEAASRISLLLQDARIKIQEIFKILLGWLRYLPGVSRAFVEQEAKIKTDQLIKLKKE